jgi:hypothetical protein
MIFLADLNLKGAMTTAPERRAAGLVCPPPDTRAARGSAGRGYFKVRGGRPGARTVLVPQGGSLPGFPR